MGEIDREVDWTAREDGWFDMEVSGEEVRGDVDNFLVGDWTGLADLLELRDAGKLG